MTEEPKGPLTPEQVQQLLEHMDGIFRVCGLPTLTDTFAPLAMQLPEEQRKTFSDQIYNQVANTIKYASVSYIDAMKAAAANPETFKSPMGACDGSVDTEHST